MREFLLERVPVLPHPQIDMLPVVEAGALDLFLVEGEAQWLDQMQRGAGRETRATGVAGVPVNLGMNQNNVNGQSGLLDEIDFTPDFERKAAAAFRHDAHAAAFFIEAAAQ